MLFFVFLDIFVLKYWSPEHEIKISNSEIAHERIYGFHSIQNILVNGTLDAVYNIVDDYIVKFFSGHADKKNPFDKYALSMLHESLYYWGAWNGCL